MSEKIVHPGLMIKMLRDAGYKSTSYAVAELVDNSIEANAKHIEILIMNEDVTVKRKSARIGSIAIFDDGAGMSPEILGRCLSFGWGTRLEGATGLGKFGFGLKGASISQAKRIDIFSWQNPDEVYMTYLDIQEIFDNDVDLLPEVEKKKLPSRIANLLPSPLPKSGTVVIWKDLDRLNPKRSETLVAHLNKEMCRIFRHYMDDNDELGDRRYISVSVLNSDGSKVGPEVLKANDPMYLLSPNNLPYHGDRATNVVDDEAKFLVLDANEVEQEVHVISSIALPEIQALGGSSEVGKHYAQNNGISFVRAGRELELDIKGFFSQSEPRHRWHGIEVRFGPQLDEYFGVPNNKQGIRGFRAYDENELNGLISDADEGDGEEKRMSKMKLDLHRIISRMVKNNESVVKSRGASKGDKTTPGTHSTAKKVSQVVRVTDLDSDTRSQKEADGKSLDIKVDELTRAKMKSDTSLTEEEARQLAKDDLENLLQIEEASWPGATFLDVQYAANAAIATINRNHPFFNEFYDFLRRSDDQKGFEALKILMLAFARTEDVLQNQIGVEKFEQIRDRWGSYMKDLAKLSS